MSNDEVEFYCNGDESIALQSFTIFAAKKCTTEGRELQTKNENEK
jgi:hypothetical protein